MSGRIDVTLKAIIDVVDLGKAGFDKRACSSGRAGATTAHHDDRLILPEASSHFAHEVLVLVSTWVGGPFDEPHVVHHRDAYKGPFGTRAAVDQDRPFAFDEEGVGIGG